MLSENDARKKRGWDGISSESRRCPIVANPDVGLSRSEPVAYLGRRFTARAKRQRFDQLRPVAHVCQLALQVDHEHELRLASASASSITAAPLHARGPPGT